MKLSYFRVLALVSLNFGENRFVLDAELHTIYRMALDHSRAMPLKEAIGRGPYVAVFTSGIKNK